MRLINALSVFTAVLLIKTCCKKRSVTPVAMEKQAKMHAAKAASTSIRNHRIAIVILLCFIALDHMPVFSGHHSDSDAYQINTVGGTQLQPAASASSDTLNKELFEGVRRTWDHFGAKQPMFGVLTQDAYKDESNMTEEAVREFWNSGQRVIDRILQDVLPDNNVSMQYGAALDFGSGVGRLSIPLARYFQRVYSVDISQNYLNVLMENAKVFKADSRIVAVLNEGDIAAGVHEPNGVDFILSLIAIQHNPPQVQRIILKQLLALLRPGGVAYLHIPYGRPESMKTDPTEEMIERSKHGVGMQMHYTPEVLIRYIAEEEANCKLLNVLQRTEGHKIVISGVFLIQKNF